MTDLVTLADVKAYLGEDTTLLDQQLQELIAGASVALGREIGEPLEKTTYTDEAYDGDGSDTIMLRHWPVVALAAVSVDGETVTAECDVDTVGELYRADGFTPGHRNVLVTYDAGYDPVPDDLKMACLMLVKFYAKSELTARSVFFEGGMGSGPERAWPDQVRMIVSGYRKARAA